MENRPFTLAGYDHCNGSTEVYRGYSCGLWTLFHAITVNAYLRNMGVWRACALVHVPNRSTDECVGRE